MGHNILLVGNQNSLHNLTNFFNSGENPDYKLHSIFKKEDEKNEHENLHTVFDDGICQIYCSIDDLSPLEIYNYITYASKHLVSLKFIPGERTVLSNKFQIEYLSSQPIISVREVNLNKSYGKILKRTFDLIFASLVIILLLSWLVPVLYILIKMESRGPLFFKHPRQGKNFEEFQCYKFRSMKLDTSEEITFNSKLKTTNIGKFLRKTSLDELPQFLNVFKGEMSVVGPRPHMVSFNEEYFKQVDKYNFIYRHTVKPGITGLAQAKGYRGEVKEKEDIINRIKYDNFYIQNWSLVFDLKIILRTFYNIVKGDKNAY